MPTTRRRKADVDRRARWSVACFVVFFVAGQAAFRAALAWRPALGDREFGRKLDDLKAQVAAEPDRPLLLMLGSSRVATGFRPGLLPPLRLSDGRRPLAFNFAQAGTGPQMAHLMLHRLLEQGIRPEWVLVEFWPPFWADDGYLDGYLASLNLAALDWSSVRLLASYLGKPGKLLERWLPAQISPIFASRSALMSRLGSGWSPGFDPDRRLENLDANGWWSPRATISETDRDRLVAYYRDLYGKRLTRFRVRPTPERALADLIAVCRREQIQLGVVVLPEGSSFRSLYSAEALAAIDAYLGRLASDAPIIDARAWLSDTAFTDGHHLLPDGAAAFTERLAHDALPALLLRERAASRVARPDRQSTKSR